MDRFERIEGETKDDGEGVPPEFADSIEEATEPEERLAEERQAKQHADKILAEFLIQEPYTSI